MDPSAEQSLWLVACWCTKKAHVFNQQRLSPSKRVGLSTMSFTSTLASSGAMALVLLSVLPTTAVYSGNSGSGENPQTDPSTPVPVRNGVDCSAVSVGHHFVLFQNQRDVKNRCAIAPVSNSICGVLCYYVHSQVCPPMVCFRMLCLVNRLNVWSAGYLNAVSLWRMRICVQSSVWRTVRNAKLLVTTSNTSAVT